MNALSLKRWSLGMSLVGLLIGSVFAGPAAAQTVGSVVDPAAVTVPPPVADVVLYEVTEAVGSKGKGAQGGFKSSHATLSGVARTGTAPCPDAIANALMGGCWVVVRATGRADDNTGIGPFVGSFEVVVQDKNTVDSPEIVVLRGHVGGDLDLSPAFQESRPVGTVSGTYTLKGVRNTIMDRQTVKGSFVGKFRLPHMDNGQPSYLLDDGTTVIVQAAEYVLGYPAVKLEISFK
jgi:hypothetical protein